MTAVSFSPAPAPDSSSKRPENLAEAAEQFEALLVHHLLRTMREGSGDGWMGTGEDKSSESLMDYSEQEMARVIAAGGSFGLAKIVRGGLTPHSDAPLPEPHTGPSR